MGGKNRQTNRGYFSIKKQNAKKDIEIDRPRKQANLLRTERKPNILTNPSKRENPGRRETRQVSQSNVTAGAKGKETQGRKGPNKGGLAQKLEATWGKKASERRMGSDTGPMREAAHRMSGN